MTLEDAETHKRNMMYTKVSAAPKAQGEVRTKTKGKAMFIKRNSIGIETNSVKKDGIRPLTARSGTPGFSVRNTSARASSQMSQRKDFYSQRKRATTALNSRRATPKQRCFSAGRTMRNMANQSTAATDSRVTLKSTAQSRHASSTQIIRPEEEEKLSNANKRLVKKFNEFLRHNARRNTTNSQKLT